ncbi:MAG: hypothetical protein ACUVRO_01055 [Armatimonadota bacterium]
MPTHIASQGVATILRKVRSANHDIMNAAQAALITAELLQAADLISKDPALADKASRIAEACRGITKSSHQLSALIAQLLAYAPPSADECPPEGYTVKSRAWEQEALAQ